MRKIYKIASLLLALLLVFVFLQSSKPSQAATGFYIDNGRLYDANGNDFVMRGVNHAHTWYTHQTSSLANIKNAGANTVRVVLSSGDRWTRNDASDVANVISLCKQNRLICMLEVHDTTGYGEEGAAASLDEAVDYWLSIQSVLTGEEAYVLINIGNEPYGNSGYQTWAADTSAAINRLRNAGFDHTIVVDAPNWGQDWTFTMRDNAASVFASDPDANTLFSIHMYGVFDTAVEIQNYLDTFVNAGLPIIVGEFGHNHSDGNPDEDTILAYTETLGLGYLGWSWSGNGGGVEYLDMVINFDPNNMSTWGDRLFNGPNGIVATAVEASVFGEPIPTNTPGGPTATSPPPPTATATSTPLPGGSCVVAYDVVNQWGGGYQADVTITNNTAVPIAGWQLTFTHADSQDLIGSWNVQISQMGNLVTASNPAGHWNGTIGASGGTVTFGLQATWSGAVVVPTDFVLNGTACNEGDPIPTNTPVPPTVTTVPPTATTVPPTATTAPPTSTSVPPTATVAPPTPTPGTGSGCSVDYAIQNDWGSGFIVNVLITNEAANTINGWGLDFTFPGNQTITNLWGGLSTQNGASVTVNNADWNGTIGANGTVSFGFQGTYSGANSSPVDFTLNSVACSN